jgi:hypothetical protein
MFKSLVASVFCCCATLSLFAAANKFRIVWETDPATSAIIAWNQVSGTNPVLLLDVNDYGKNADDYAVVKRPDLVSPAKSMKNHFVHLTGLRPNTTYYFLIKDSEGVSRRYFFVTAPTSPDERLSIIAGGDSRNFRDARQEANSLVAKLRPHFVMFGGDFTADDTDLEWQEWLDDWQLTIAKDGRMTPIIVTRGNHEESNRTITDVFGIKNANVYYAMSLGGNLLRIYTLNSMMPAGGEQRDWLETDLRSNAGVSWKIAQYHHPMRPHTAKKSEKNDMVVHWASLFHKYGLNVAVECDAHCVKSTWPIRPSNGPGSHEGFIRDDESGTVYIGEGCWGAPLRENNDDKPWTRASGSFNQFHWIFVDKEKIEIRYVKTDGAEQVAEVNPCNIFLAPRGLNIWNPPAGDVVKISKQPEEVPQTLEDVWVSRSGHAGQAVAEAALLPSQKTPSANEETDETGNWESCPMLMCDNASGEVKLKYNVEQEGAVVIRLINLRLQEVIRLELPNQTPGEYLKALKINHLPAGRYLAVVKGNKKVLRRYRLLKKE